MVRPVRRCSRQDRTVALILFRESLLTAGRNEVKIFPFFPRARRPRNSNPGNANDVCL
jgi:hypothetical protein